MWCERWGRLRGWNDTVNGSVDALMVRDGLLCDGLMGFHRCWLCLFFFFFFLINAKICMYMLFDAGYAVWMMSDAMRYIIGFVVLLGT